MSSLSLIRSNIQGKRICHYLLCFLSLACAVIGMPAYAEDVLQYGGEACYDGSSDDSGQSMAGKPIDLFTGNESLRHTDLSLGSFFPIVIQRQYISSSQYDSPLGYGWALNHDKRLYNYLDGTIVVRKDCGQKVLFVPGSNGFEPKSVKGVSLVQDVVNGTYTFTESDGTKEIYDRKGRLVTKRHPTGNSLVFTYGSDVRGPLTGLSLYSLDTTPRIVSFDYRLTMIEEVNAQGIATGRRVTFSYESGTGRK
jgi:hypothetical protein